jgi:RNA polymerase sigma-70 factor (ECF subfamily)
MRWELNDLARRLDAQTQAVELQEGFVPAPEASVSQLSPNALRMLEAIESLPEEEREVFSLVRVQGMAHTEVAEVLGTSTKTVQRRLNRALMVLAEQLGDLNPTPPPNEAE